MSGTERFTAPRVTAPILAFKADLERIGVPVPDQIRAHQVKEAHRLGFEANVSPVRLEKAWIRRACAREWREFSYDSFQQVRHAAYGGKVPVKIEKLAELITSKLPDVDLVIYAKPSDPVFAVRRDGVEIILQIWDRIYGELPTFYL